MSKEEHLAPIVGSPPKTKRRAGVHPTRIEPSKKEKSARRRERWQRRADDSLAYVSHE